MFRKIIVLTLGVILASNALATVVEVRTNVGSFQINLFDEDTPETVANFLDYVNSGAYSNTIVHRLATEFVIQSGGFQFNSALPLDEVITGPAVNNEPVLSNVRATIAMAKVSGDPNSATSQWFINLADNSANLDIQNQGFTVFGQVINDGMDVVDQIAQNDVFDFGGSLTSVPLQNYTATDAANGVAVTAENFILISDVVVVDASTVTNPDLVPVPNTLLSDQDSEPVIIPDTNSGSSGGVLNVWLCLLLVAHIVVKRRSNVKSTSV